MARIYVSEQILPAVKMITKAYIDRKVTAEAIMDMAYNMAHCMACHKEETEKKEEKFPHTPLKEERKEKEEKVCVCTKKTKKRIFFQGEVPSFEEVEEYHKEQGFTTFTPGLFFSNYNANNWIDANGLKVVNWRAKMQKWEERNINRQKNGKIKDTDSKGGDEREKKGEQELREWLDGHYPVDAEMAAMADTLTAEGTLTLAEMSTRCGKEVIYRRVIGELYLLGVALNSSQKTLRPFYLELMAKEVLAGMATTITMTELKRRLKQCKRGEMGRFSKGLTMTDVMKAMRTTEVVN